MQFSRHECAGLISCRVRDAAKPVHSALPRFGLGREKYVLTFSVNIVLFIARLAWPQIAEGHMEKSQLDDSEGFSSFLRSTRLALGMSLRDFAKASSLDISYLSKLERGVNRAPVSPASRGRLAAALGIKGKSEGWRRFCDLADADAGRIPEDIRSDDAVARHLPAFFRTLRGQPVSKASARTLIEKLRASFTPDPEPE